MLVLKKLRSKKREEKFDTGGRVMMSDMKTIHNGYIVPGYETLHTQGKDYIVNDIIELMKERGVMI